MSLTEHAHAELLRAGTLDADPDKAACLLACTGVADAFIAAGQLAAGDEIAHELGLLLRHGALTPLTDDPGEWADRSAATGAALWQNLRDPNVFSDDGGATYYRVVGDRITDTGPVTARLGRHRLRAVD